jgi:hypothetical protein
MANKWLVHIKKTMKKMKAAGTYKKGLGLKQVILAAKKTWHKAKKGGADDDGALVDVPLDDVKDSKSDSTSEQPAPEDSNTIGKALGGRRRTRRRRHSRRR